MPADNSGNGRLDRIEANLEAHTAALRNIDQRLARLTERQEALTQAIEPHAA